MYNEIGTRTVQNWSGSYNHRIIGDEFITFEWNRVYFDIEPRSAIMIAPSTYIHF
jgi:hypothetical protein